MRKSKLYLVGLVGAVALAAVVAGVAVASSGGAGGPIVSAVGKEFWESNGFVAVTFRWDPGTLTVPSGSSVTFVHGATGGEPHTVTIATKKAQLPKSFDGPCKPCQIASGHLKNPQNDNSAIKSYVLNKGQPGLDTVGDSIALAPKGPHSTYTTVVSAPAGTTLYFVCAVHPWMQGKIIVSS